ncbi:MAG: DUF4271 domain-containing protein [Williamsia sp.]|nr:DUF4271 domain-containing protein [Williamsia sp.]
MKQFYLLLWLMGCALCSFAQTETDTAPPKKAPVVVKKPVPVQRRPAADSANKKQDSVQARHEAKLDSLKRTRTTQRLVYTNLLRQHPYFNFFANGVAELPLKRADESKDPLFYLLVGIVLFFAFIKLIFGKYLNNLFAFFFRASMRQKQMREHLMHSPVPALLLNLFFVIAGGIFASFVMLYHQYHTELPLWRLMLYSVLALASVYLVKLIVLKIVGWIFGIQEAVNTYIFVVYSINKLIGIFLVPFVVLLAFSERRVSQLLITLSCIMIVLLFLYRYIVAYVPVRREIRVSQFHFLIYICAFEVMPLLLICKVLLDFLERST